MILTTKKADVNDTTEIPVEGLEGVFLEVRTTFREDEISKILSANKKDVIEAQDLATILFLIQFKNAMRAPHYFGRRSIMNRIDLQ